MKKTFVAVALSSLFASVAANAAVVYDKDGTKAEVYGRAQANLYDVDGAHIGSTAKDTAADSTTLIGTGRLGLQGSTAVNSSLTAIGRGEWQVNAENSSTTNQFDARYLYLGVDAGQAGKVVIGQTDTSYYDTLVTTDIFDEWGDEAYASGRQEGQVIYSGAWNGFRASAGYQFADASQSLDNAYGASLGYTFAAGFGLGAGAESRSYDQDSSTLDKDNRWAVTATYGTVGAPGLYAAALYNESKKSYFGTDADTTDKGWELVTAYALKNNWTFSAGYNRYYTTGQGADVVSYYLVDAQYKFTSNFLTYAVYRFDDGKSAGVENKDALTLAAQYNF